MSARSIIVVVLALGSGVSAAVLVRQFRAPRAPAQAVDTVPVLVAATHVDARTRISKELIATRSFSKESVPTGALGPDDQESVVGQYSIMPLLPGDVLTREKLGASGSPAAQLAPGRVAFSIGTSGAEQSNANLLHPGDRVNLLFSPRDSNVMSRAITIMRNMLVLATNTRLSGELQGGQSDFPQIRSITLEVTDEQAEVLAWVTRNGTLSVTLQSAAVDPEGLPPDMTVEDIQMEIGLLEPEPEPIVEIVETADEAPETERDADPDTVQVLVAARDVPPQTRLTSQFLKAIEWPIEHAPESAFLADQAQDVIGMYTVTTLVAGEMLIPAKISDRAGVNWQVSPGSVLFKITSSLGLVFPGDQVNVIFTPRNSGGVNNPGSLTILSNKRVFATNDKPPQESTLGQTQFQEARSVLLEVTQRQSEMLSWATQNGTLSVALLGHGSDLAALPADMSLEELRQSLEPPPAAVEVEPDPEPPAAAEPIEQEAVATILEMRGLGLGESRVRLPPVRRLPAPSGNAEAASGEGPAGETDR